MDTTEVRPKSGSQQLPRDVFLYLLMIGTLAASATAVGTVLFQLINLYVPEAVKGYYYVAQSAVQSIRWAVSSLVVVFPVLAWVTRFLSKDITAHPEKRELRIRKWLLYLTLFITGVIMIGDLVSLVYTYLQGDLTLRFVLKIASVFLIAGTIFYYYLRQLHGDPKGRARIVGWAASVCVVAALVAGFIVAGSPSAQKQYGQDDQRINDLSNIQYQITTYWQANQKLPAALSNLKDSSVGGYVVPVDPVTRAAYEYTATGTTTFRLCATFARATRFAELAWPDEQDWSHQAGRQCFDRTLNPAYYPPLLQGETTKPVVR